MAVRLSGRRAHKYGAKAQVVDGIRFASQKEARRYQELKLLEKAGAISDLSLQDSFTLTAPNGRVIGKYVADFSYWDRRGAGSVYEDVKGFRTPLYKWKKKHVEAQYGVTITEV